jgi:hypothetical protein
MSQLSSESSRQVTVRALLLGDRIETAGLERRDVISTTPLTFRIEGGCFSRTFSIWRRRFIRHVAFARGRNNTQPQ